MTKDSEAKPEGTTEAVRYRPWGVYLKQLAAHLWFGVKSLWPIWVVIASVVVFWALFASPLAISGCREIDIRWFGMFLQLVGFLTVAMGLRDSGKLFEEPSVWDRIRHYFSSFPTRKVVNHILEANGVSASLSTMNARVTITPGPNTPLQRRVEILEEKAEQLFDEVGNLGVELKTKTTELNGKFEEETKLREAGDKSLQDQLEKALLGGIHLEWWGVVFFVVGVFLASAAPEVSDWLGHPRSCGS